MIKRNLHKLPFWFKLWWAKQFICMFKGFGPTFTDDIVLYNELDLWIRTNGKPTTSNKNYQIRSKIEKLEKELQNMPSNDPRDAYEARHIQVKIEELRKELAKC